MSAPIWVTDPAGNANPYLSFVGKGKFIAGTSANYYYSKDGINWVTANVPSSVIGLPTPLVFTETDCNQGFFAAAFHSNTFPNEQFGWMTSSDGLNWTRAILSTDSNNQTMSYANNAYTFTPIAGMASPVTVPNPNFPPPTLTFNDMDVLQTAPLADPSQSASAPSIPANQILKNSLGPPLTAIRRGAGGKPFQYTTTTITDAIVSSGATWPGATWTTPPTWSITNNLGADIFYAAIGTGR